MLYESNAGNGGLGSLSRCCMEAMRATGALVPYPDVAVGAVAAAWEESTQVALTSFCWRIIIHPRLVVVASSRRLLLPACRGIGEFAVLRGGVPLRHSCHGL